MIVKSVEVFPKVRMGSKHENAFTIKMTCEIHLKCVEKMLQSI